MDSLIILKLAEEIYAGESAQACAAAEEAAAQTQQYPVVYPEPFQSLGCGYGPLMQFVLNSCLDLTSELGLDADFCSQTDLQLTLVNVPSAKYQKFMTVLATRLEPVRPWILNGHELWST